MLTMKSEQDKAMMAKANLPMPRGKLVYSICLGIVKCLC